MMDEMTLKRLGMKEGEYGSISVMSKKVMGVEEDSKVLNYGSTRP